MSKQIKAPAANKIQAEKKKIVKEEEQTEFRCTIDLTNCTDFIEPKKLVAFLRQRIKVNGKAGNTKGIEVKVQDKIVSVTTSTASLCKRYIKYLIKKFLKKNNLREWLRVVSDKKEGFELKFFNMQNDEEEEEAEE